MRNHQDTSPEGLRIEADDLEALRKGAGGRAPSGRIFDRCLAWVRANWEDGPDQDCQEIVVDGIDRELGPIFDAGLDAATVGRVLTATLGNLLAERRSLSTSLVEEEQNLLSKFDFSQFDRQISSAFALAVARAAKIEIETALNLLEARDRDLLIVCHKLNEVGYVICDPDALVFTDLADQRKAYLKAHKEFMRLLEAVLSGAAVALNNDREVVKESLVLIRGDAALHTLAGLNGLDTGGAT